MKKICVASGKGGVGKTTITISLSIALAKRKYRVGIVDCDLTGPNLPDVLGDKELIVDYNRDVFIPAEASGVKFVSLAQIVSKRDPVIWKGKDLSSASRQLLERTEWKELDFLILDTPPGTGPEVLTILPLMDYVLLVTEPSRLSKSKVVRTMNLCREHQIPILGLVMNKVRGRSEQYDLEENKIPTLYEIKYDEKIIDTNMINDFNVDVFLEAMKRPIILKRETMIGKGKKWILKKMLKLWGD